jgi:hypothetical protein
MITKEINVDVIEVVSGGFVQVRTKTNVFENGTLIGSSLHRHVVAPGDDYSNEDARVQAICAATHTSEVIEAFKAAIAAQGV